MLTWPVRSLGRMIAEMSKAGVSIERIRYIMNSPVEQDNATSVSFAFMENMKSKDRMIRITIRKTDVNCSDMKFFTISTQAVPVTGLVLGSRGSDLRSAGHADRYLWF